MIMTNDRVNQRFGGNSGAVSVSDGDKDKDEHEDQPPSDRWGDKRTTSWRLTCRYPVLAPFTRVPSPTLTRE